MAYTTVLSTMDNLCRKGHLPREQMGKAHRYRAVVSHAEHTPGLTRKTLRAPARTPTSWGR
ncbi:MAG: BlaI/MecI/CopY family transcriptional regulator [Actinomycetota bacterium]|nr:BlaI/MecI/CopY family transcriptional regulator [Actinomycetota bacterium]